MSPGEPDPTPADITLLTLPSELIHEILSYLPISDLAAFRATSRRLHIVYEAAGNVAVSPLRRDYVSHLYARLRLPNTIRRVKRRRETSSTGEEESEWWTFLNSKQASLAPKARTFRLPKDVEIWLDEWPHEKDYDAYGIRTAVPWVVDYYAVPAILVLGIALGVDKAGEFVVAELGLDVVTTMSKAGSIVVVVTFTYCSDAVRLEGGVVEWKDVLKRDLEWRFGGGPKRVSSVGTFGDRRKAVDEYVQAVFAM